MEEININNVNVDEPKNENEFLIMCNDFKKRFEEKNKQINTLKIIIINLYGLVNVLDKYEDISLVHIIQEILEEAMSKHLNIDIGLD